MNASDKIDFGLDDDDLDDFDASPLSGARSVPEVIDQALVSAVGYFVEQGTIEMSALRLEHLLDELHKATLKAASFDEAIGKVVYALVESKHVEEVFGTDEELAQVLRQAFKLAAEELDDAEAEADAEADEDEEI
jgi:hypothetical protein